MVQPEISGDVEKETRDASPKLFIEDASSLSSNYSKQSESKQGIEQVPIEDESDDMFIRDDGEIEADPVSVNEILSSTQASPSPDEKEIYNKAHSTNQSDEIIDYFDTDKIEKIIESLHTDASSKENPYISDLEEDVIIDENRSTKQNSAKPNKAENTRSQIVYSYPIIIKFKKQQYKLFPTDKQIAEYSSFPILLKDKDLYKISFEEFFPQLRSAFVRIGKPLSIAYELFLNFKDLDLTVNEDNIYTTEIRLREIIMMFHNVNKNTNKAHTKDCVLIDLSLHKRFSTCFNHIIDIAKAGKGFETLEKPSDSDIHEEQPVFIVDDDSDQEGHRSKTAVNNTDNPNIDNNSENNLNDNTNFNNYTLSANFIKKGKRKLAKNDAIDHLSDIEPDNILNCNTLKNSLEGINVFDKDYSASEKLVQLSSSLKHGLIEIDPNEILVSKKSRNI